MAGQTSIIKGFSTPAGIAVSGNTLYVANEDSDTVSVVNTTTGKIVGTYEARGLWYIVKDDVTKANKMFRAGLLTKG